VTSVRAGRTSAADRQDLRSFSYAVVLRQPRLRAVAAAHAISMFGTVASDSALSLLVFRETGSDLLAALAFSAVFVPQAVSGSLLAGLAGRYRARTILVGANVLSTLLAAGMAVPGMPVAGQLALAGLLGAILPIHDGTRTAMLIDSLEHDAFLAVRSVLRIIAQIAVVTGFAAGGLLSALASPRDVLLGNAASFAIAALLLLRATAGIPALGNTVPATAGGQAAHPIRDSLRAAALTVRRRKLRRTALLFWMPVAFASAGTALAVAYATGIGQGGTAVGLLLAAFAGGMAAGEICFSRVSVSVRRRSAVALITLTQVPAVGFAMSPPLPVALVLRALSGVGFAYLQGIDTDLARSLDSGMRRRVMVVLSSGVMACQGVAMAAAGVLAQFTGPSLVIAGSGAVGTVACLAAISTVTGRHHRLPGGAGASLGHHPGATGTRRGRLHYATGRRPHGRELQWRH
jgi:hypothetical protein